MFPRTITIDVTLSDIAHGKRRSCSNCPVALAAIRAFERVVNPEKEYTVRVDAGDLTVYDCQKGLFSGRFYAYLPNDVQGRIEHFDEFGDMEPFSFSVSNEEV